MLWRDKSVQTMISIYTICVAGSISGRSHAIHYFTERFVGAIAIETTLSPEKNAFAFVQFVSYLFGILLPSVSVSLYLDLTGYQRSVSYTNDDVQVNEV